MGGNAIVFITGLGKLRLKNAKWPRSVGPNQLPKAGRESEAYLTLHPSSAFPPPQEPLCNVPPDLPPPTSADNEMSLVEWAQPWEKSTLPYHLFPEI